MSETTNAETPTIVLVHGAFAGAVLEVHDMS
jgi:hypothetical protein